MNGEPALPRRVVIDLSQDGSGHGLRRQKAAAVTAVLESSPLPCEHAAACPVPSLSGIGTLIAWLPEPHRTYPSVGREPAA